VMMGIDWKALDFGDCCCIIISILMKLIVIKKKVNKNTRETAKPMYVMDYAKSNDCMRWIHPWQNERQRSLNNFMSCKHGN